MRAEFFSKKINSIISVFLRNYALDILEVTQYLIDVDYKEILYWAENKKAPFSQKKSFEFKDAKSLKVILNHARKNEKLYNIILSDDEDWKSFEKIHSSTFTSLESFYSDYIKERKGLTEELLGSVNHLLESIKANDELLARIKNWVTENEAEWAEEIINGAVELEVEFEYNSFEISEVNLSDFESSEKLIDSILNSSNEENETLDLYINIGFKGYFSCSYDDFYTASFEKGRVVFAEPIIGEGTIFGNASINLILNVDEDKTLPISFEIDLVDFEDVYVEELTTRVNPNFFV